MEMEYSLFCLDIEANSILSTCRELGISIIAYAPIGRGILSGIFRSQSDLPEQDLRRFLPKYSEENFPKFMKLVVRLEEIGAAKNATAAQIALEWLLHQGSDIVPIPGTKNPDRMEENLKAADLVLTEEVVKELRFLAENMDIQGTRYPEASVFAPHVMGTKTDKKQGYGCIVPGYAAFVSAARALMHLRERLSQRSLLLFLVSDNNPITGKRRLSRTIEAILTIKNC